MARLVVSAAAAVVGFYLGGPTVALQAFTITYGLTAGLDPNKKVLGPRLQDLKAPQASYGAVIPYIEGAPRLAGVYIWSSNKREIATTTTEGKGGPGVDSTTFTYEIDVLIELAINRCQAIRRIWSNGKLVWSNADDADGETLIASAQTTSWRDLRFYSGGPTQLPDPTYEAAVGIGNAPAYRTRTTVMIEGLNLGGSGQLPVLTFEVLSEADLAYASFALGSRELDVGFFGDGESPNTAGITAMSVGGFQYLYGSDYDSGVGAFENYKVWSVSPDGTSTQVESWPLPRAHSGTMRGTTDESVIVAGYRDTVFVPIENYTVAFADGSHVNLDTSATRGRQEFAMRGGDIVLGGSEPATNGNDLAIRKYSKSNGVLVATSVPMATEVQSIAIAGGYIFALSSDNFGTGDTIYQIDLATMALVDSLATPFNFDAGSLVGDGDGNLYAFTFGTVGNPFSVLRWDGGATWTLVWDNLPDMFAASPSRRHSNFTDGQLFGTQYYTNDPNPTENFELATAKTAIVLPTLAEVVSRLCLRTRLLTANDIDVTELESDYVRSMALTTVSPTRGAIEVLMAAYLFDCAEGEKLRFVKRGGASVVTIPFVDLGFSANGDGEPLPLKRASELETVARVSVKYANVLNDSQDGVEQGDRLITDSVSEVLTEVPLGFTPTEAKRLADANTMDEAVKMIAIGPITLSRKYSALEVTDPFVVTADNGSTFRVRALKGKVGGGLLNFDLVLDDATAISSVGETDEDYVSSTLIRLLSDTELEMLDIPILRDADDALGPYAAVSAGPKWSGAQLDKSVDNSTFAKIGTFTTKTAIGRTTTVLGDWPDYGLFDEENSVDVDVGDSTLASYSKPDALAGLTPAYLIGDEIIYACSAALQSPGVYRLTSLLRALRGTEAFLSTHASGERVVLLQLSGAGLRKVSDEIADLNATRYYRETTIGRSTADSDVDTFIDTGVALKPFAPVDLHVTEEDGSLVLEWDRRSRLSSVLFGTTEPPLGEASELYDVELRDGSDVLIESGTVSEPAYPFSGLAAGTVLDAPLWGVREISTEFVGVREDLPNSFTQARYVARCAADGSFMDQTASIGQRVFQIANIGDAIYVATDRYSNTFPTYILSSQVYKFTRTSLGTIDATNTAGTLGDYAGLVSDGTNVWISERTSGNLRKLNPTTLVSVASYAVTGTPTALFFTTGKIWITCEASDEVARFDIATLAEDLRFSVVSRPFDVLVDGGNVFVWGETELGVYDDTTGALVQTHTFGSVSGLPQRGMAVFGSEIAAVGLVPSSSLVKLLFLDDTTGARDNLLSSPYSGQTWFVAGSDGADLFITGAPPSTSLETRRYTFAAPGLAGCTVTVWQKSATVGRGTPASLEL